MWRAVGFLASSVPTARGRAIYPLELMPPWLKVIAVINPLTYLVDALRGAMIVGGKSIYADTTSFGIMLMVFAVLLALASKLYPGLAR